MLASHMTLQTLSRSRSKLDNNQHPRQPRSVLAGLASPASCGAHWHGAAQSHTQQTQLGCNCRCADVAASGRALPSAAPAASTLAPVLSLLVCLRHQRTHAAAVPTSQSPSRCVYHPYSSSHQMSTTEAAAATAAAEAAAGSEPDVAAAALSEEQEGVPMSKKQRKKLAKRQRWV